MNRLILIFSTVFLTSCYFSNTSTSSIDSKKYEGKKLDIPTINTYKLPNSYKKAKPQPMRNLKFLIKRADDMIKFGNYKKAALILERSIKISPDDPILWNKLAHVRLALKQYRLAERIARKSNSLNPYDANLRDDNWLIINQSRNSKNY
tara:strand:- start:395 stop:841 length:447 start_codon:yes stop_codon:yes gene_type:complete